MQPQPTAIHNDEKNASTHQSIVVLNDRIEAYRRSLTLYGREPDVQLIASVYHRFVDQLRQRDDSTAVAASASEFICIHGDNGIGKSALVRYFFMNNDKPLMINQERCFCIKGEMDQRINLRAPNTAFIDAFTLYVHQIKERKLLDHFHKILQQSSITKVECDVLIQMIPPISDLFDRDTTSPNVTQLQRSDATATTTITGSFDMPLPNDAMSAFKYALLKFLRIVATCTHPIILVLEDIHRADESALNLITFLMNHTNTNAILFVGTTRDDVNSERLEIMLRKLSFQNTMVTHVHLRHLDAVSTSAMISNVLNVTDRNLLHTVMEVMGHQQCLCNPYSVLTFLSTLARNGSLTYHASSVPMWQLDPIKLQYFNHTMTLDVLSDQPTVLPDHAIESLRLAALFGMKIEVDVIGHLMNLCHADTMSNLSTAVKHGILVTDPSGNFSFVHEVVLDTLFQSIPKAEREEFHYVTGRRLWQWYDLEQLDDNILDVVRLLLVGERYIVKERERVAVAKLCLRSGERSVYISSFRSAFTYVVSGINLLGSDGWKSEYQLALDLHNAAAELAYCTGKGSEALELCNVIGNEARCFDDALTAHDIKVRALGAVGKVKESLDFGLNILSKLGESFPAKPSKIRCLIGYQIIRTRLKNRTSESLLRLPIMTDGRKTIAVKIMNQLFTNCLQLNPLMAVMLACRVISRTLDYGISATSCLGFVSLGAFLTGPALDIDEGYRIGRVGMAMYEKFKIKVWLAPLAIMYFLGIHSFKHKMSSIVEPLQYAAQVGEETGNIEESIFCEFSVSFLQYEHLSLLTNMNLLREARKKMLFNGLATLHALSTPTMESFEVLVGLRGIDSCTKYQNSDGIIFAFSHFHTMLLHIILGNVDAAAQSSVQIRTISRLPIGSVDAAMIAFYDGLTAVRSARRSRKWHNMKYGMKKVRQLSKYATHAPDLFLCRVFLLEAEIASIKGENCAHTKYVAAIALAKDSGCLSVAALGNESAGYYHLYQKDDLQVAKMHFQEAIHYYELWGATAKVTQLTHEVQSIFDARIGSGK